MSALSKATANKKGATSTSSSTSTSTSTSTSSSSFFKPAAKPTSTSTSTSISTPTSSSSAQRKRKAQDDDDDDSEEDESALISFDEPRAPSKTKPKPKTKSDTADDEEEDVNADVDGTDDPDDSITIEFGLYDPRPEDYWIVKTLMARYVDEAKRKPESDALVTVGGSDNTTTEKPKKKKQRSSSSSEPVTRDNFNLNELAELVAGQVSVGTMIKADASADDQALGFITCINIHHHKSLECISQLQRWLLSHCPQQQRSTMEFLFNNTSKPLGLILQDRLVNVPIEIVGPLHRALYEDIAWAQKNESDPTLRASFQFENFILVARCFQAGSGRLSSSSETSTKKNKKKKSSGPVTGVGYYRFEEELYQKESFLSYSFAASSTDMSDADGDFAHVPQSRVVMVFHRSKFESVLKQIEAIVAGAE